MSIPFILAVPADGGNMPVKIELEQTKGKLDFQKDSKINIDLTYLSWPYSQSQVVNTLFIYIVW